jgi:GR25 family glycosyltransferase involved in LPS biosynthesis
MTSQLNCIRTAIDTDKIVAVCEDDVVFCADLQERLAYIARNMTWDWDIFWLGGTFHCNPAVWHKDSLGRDVVCTSDPRIMRTYGIWSTYAYLVNGPSARRVVDLFDRGGLEANMDDLGPALALHQERRL